MNCKNCDTPLSGRAGKKFCSATCRAQYWYKQNPKIDIRELRGAIVEIRDMIEMCDAAKDVSDGMINALYVKKMLLEIKDRLEQAKEKKE